MKELEKRLGYHFRDWSYLQTALTHSSYANEPNHLCQSNERLEFLGDSILGFCTARTIYNLYPEMPEGVLSRLRAQLVCEANLHEVALQLQLGKYMRLGNNEIHSGGRSTVSILADCVEAIIAAIYLDGGMEPAEDFIARRILQDVKAGTPPLKKDYKTQLQEVVQKTGDPPPVYAIVDESGPDHDKTFVATVSLPLGLDVRGTGKSKKEAEQAAARAALEKLKK